MDRVDVSHLAPLHGPARGPLRVAPMANPPAAEIARQRAAAEGGGTDSIEFSAAARRLAEAQRPWAADNTAPARPAAADRLVGARVEQAAFEPSLGPTAAPTRGIDAPLPFYRDPGQTNAAATAVAGARLDVTG